MTSMCHLTVSCRHQLYTVLSAAQLSSYDSRTDQLMWAPPCMTVSVIIPGVFPGVCLPVHMQCYMTRISISGFSLCPVAFVPGSLLAAACLLCRSSVVLIFDCDHCHSLLCSCLPQIKVQWMFSPQQCLQLLHNHHGIPLWPNISWPEHLTVTLQVSALYVYMFAYRQCDTVYMLYKIVLLY